MFWSHEFKQKIQPVIKGLNSNQNIKIAKKLTKHYIKELGLDPIKKERFNHPSNNGHRIGDVYGKFIFNTKHWEFKINFTNFHDKKLTFYEMSYDEFLFYFDNTHGLRAFEKAVLEVI